MRLSSLSLPLALLIAGCSSPSGPVDAGVIEDLATAPYDLVGLYQDGPIITPDTKLSVTGTVLDFETDMPVAGAPMIAVAGLAAPTVSTNGAAYTIGGIPPTSFIFVRAAVPTTHRPTYNPPVIVGTADLVDKTVRTVAEAYVTKLLADAGVTPKANTGIILAQLTDLTGKAKAGIPASALLVTGGAPPHAPIFLDASRLVDKSATVSSASGWVLLVNVPPGMQAVSGASGTYILSSATPVEAGAITLMRLKVTPTPPAITNVSLVSHLVPIFKDRQCTICHTTGGSGNDRGGLVLDGADVYTELTQEISIRTNTPRVSTSMPEKSLLLTMPSLENPADSHPNAIFASTSDADYRTILTWIQEGAKNN